MLCTKNEPAQGGATPEPAMPGRHLRVYVATQTLELCAADGQCLARYPVSTARRGCGEWRGSEQTPRGWHVVRAKIGAHAPLAAAFRARRPTGEIYRATPAQPGRDWILTRILWLSGREVGRNRLGPRDSMRRYIYIHGSPDDGPLADMPFGTVPASHGCVRMRNADVAALFDAVHSGMPVLIEPEQHNVRPSLANLRLEVGPWAQEAPALAALRRLVFVQEQGVPLALELDEHDPDAWHLLARSPSGSVVGCVRCVHDHIGRLAVRADWRGLGLGRALLQQAMRHVHGAGYASAVLAAQVQALAFYQQLGFVAEGPVFDDAGIAHQLMRGCDPC